MVCAQGDAKNAATFVLAGLRSRRFFLNAQSIGRAHPVLYRHRRPALELHAAPDRRIPGHGIRLPRLQEHRHTRGKRLCHMV